MASEGTPEIVAERVDAHYAAALQAVRLAARDHHAHAAKIDAAHGTERGMWQTQRDLAARDGDQALGAAALEELADVLGIASCSSPHLNAGETSWTRGCRTVSLASAPQIPQERSATPNGRLGERGSAR